MNIFTLLSFFAFICYVYLGIQSFRMDRRSALNRSMLYVCASLSIWALAYTFLYTAETAEAASHWYRFSLFGWGLHPFRVFIPVPHPHGVR